MLAPIFLAILFVNAAPTDSTFAGVFKDEYTCQQAAQQLNNSPKFTTKEARDLGVVAICMKPLMPV